MAQQSSDRDQATLIDELEQLRTALEQAYEENARLAADRRVLLDRIAAQATAIGPIEGARTPSRTTPADVASEARLRDEEAMRVALEELQAMTEELEASNNGLRDANRDLDRRVEERTRDLADAHAALKAREAELRLVADALPILVGFVDRERRFGFANRAWSDWFGRRQQRILGEAVAEVVGNDLFAAWSDGIESALNGFSATSRQSLARPGRRRRELETRFVPRRTGAGQVDGFYVLAEDITEQTRAEAVLRDAAATLEAKVAERTAELEAEMASRAQTEAALRQAQKMEAIGHLTGGVAHDFNNLLTVIGASAELLRRPGLTEDRRRRYVDAVLDTVGRAGRLTAQLLAFARRQALKPEVFEVGQRLRGLTDLVNSVLGARIAVVLEADGPACHVRADASQFETALVNMAVNARDAMGGEGRLTLRLHPGAAMPPVRGHAGAAGRFVAVSMSDTGAGIAPDILGQIFEPFFTTKEPGQGTGLGLSQVFGFAKQSGGTVSVDSQVGRGTTFTLFLPQVDAEDAGRNHKPAPADAVPGGDGLRILVVDDNVEIGGFATQMLQDLGYYALWVAGAAEALDRLPTGFDAVFSDVMMPGMNGLDLAREARRRFPDLPVVLTSGYSHALAKEGPGEFPLLHKPYSAEQLSRTLRQAIGTARSAGGGSDGGGGTSGGSDDGSGAVSPSERR